MTTMPRQERGEGDLTAQEQPTSPVRLRVPAAARAQRKSELKIIPGAIVLANNRVFRVDGLDSLTTVRAYDVVTGEALTLPLHQIESPPPQRASKDPLIFPEDEWERGAKLAATFAPYLDMSRLPGAIRLGLSVELGITPRQVSRYFARFLGEPTASAMVRRPRGRRAGCKLLDPSVEFVIAHTHTKWYARREGISLEDLVARVRGLCRRLGLNPPNPKTIRRRALEAAGYRLDRSRNGAKAAKQRWEPRPGRLPQMRALELVQIDHTLVDLLVLSDDRAQVLGRPWLTLAMDVGTRTVLGLYLTMSAPSAVSVARCIAHAVLPKRENEWRHELWPMHGLMSVVHVDNAKELKSLALKRGCQQHGIQIEWRPLGKAHYGAHIERLMGTLMRLVHGLPGTTFSNIQQRKDYPSDKRATMTLAELRVWLTLKICLRYHTRRHRSLGMAPQLCWERAWQGKQEGEFYSPRQPIHAATFRMDFLPLESRRLQRTGVQFERSRYWHPKLTPLITPNAQITLRYEPEDLSRIWILDTTTDTYIEAAAVQGRAVGEGVATITQVEHSRMEEMTESGFALCDELEAAASRETRKLRRALARTESKPPKEAYPPARGKRGGRRNPASQPGRDEATIPMPPAAGKLHVEEWS